MRRKHLQKRLLGKLLSTFLLLSHEPADDRAESGTSSFSAARLLEYAEHAQLMAGLNNTLCLHRAKGSKIFPLKIRRCGESEEEAPQDCCMGVQSLDVE